MNRGLSKQLTGSFLGLNFKKWVFIFIASVLNVLSMIHVNFLLAWIAFPFLFYVILNLNSKKQTVFTGGLFGGLSSLFLNYWMIPVITNYAQGSVFIGILCWLITSITLAIFFSFQFYLYSLIKISESRKISFINNAILVACLWVVFEWIRAEAFNAIPWLSFSVGISQASNLFLIQAAAFGGVYILSFIVVFSAYLVAFAFYRRQWKLLLIPLIILGFQFTFGFVLYNNVQKEANLKSENSFSIALILAGLSPETVWNEKNVDSLVGHLLSLNSQATEKTSDLIVWSESVIPWTYSPDDDFLNEIRKKTAKTNSYSLIGMNSENNNSSDILCNSVYLLDSSGKESGRYDKQNLLTLVEKPLFKDNGSIILPFLKRAGLKMKQGNFNNAIKTPWGKVGVLLCNESTYSSFTSELVENGATYLVNIGNDAWFSDYFITRQHFYNCRLRAIETRKDILINNNMGFSGVVNASGEITAQFDGKNSGVQFAKVFPNHLPFFKPVFFIYLIFFILILLIFKSKINQQIKSIKLNLCSMKKLLFLFFFTCISYSTFAVAVVTQKDWRWRNNDGSESTATSDVAQNQGITKSLCTDRDTLRLRMSFLVEEDPSNPGNYANKSVDWKISYSTSPTGTFTKISNVAGGNHFILTSSSLVSGGTATTQQLNSGTNTYAAGQVIDKTTSTNIVFETPANESRLTEYEWVIFTTANTQAQTYYFKLEGLNNYNTVFPSLTLIDSPPTSSLQNLFLCDGQSVTVGTNTYTSTGVYTDVFTNVGGCDSTVTTNLTVAAAIADQTLTSTQTELCGSGSTTIELGSSESGVNYYLRNDLNDTIVDGPISGTGAGISFNTSNISTTTTYNILAENTTNIPSQALEFGGNATVNFVNIGNSINSVFTGTSNITVEAWVNRTSTGSLQSIVSNYESDMQYLLRIDNDKAAFWVSNGSWMLAEGTSTLPVNSWVHLSGTWDGSTIKIYVNGVLEGTTSYSGTFPSSSNNLKIGGGRSNGTEYFPGSISDVRIWNISKTQLQIDTDKASCLSGNETGLIAHYKMNDGTSSSTLTDLTGNGYNGVLTNMDPSTAWVAGPPAVSCTFVCQSEMTQTATVTVNPLPTVTANTTASAVCDGDMVTLTGGGASTYTWDNSVIDGVAFTPLATTTYTVTGTDGNGCTNTASVTVTVKTLPVDQTVAAMQSEFCASGSTTIDIGSSETGVNYYLRNDLNDTIVDGPIAGTGAGISFNTGTISTTTSYNVMAENENLATNYALNFDGANDYVNVPTGINLANQSFTIEFWAKRNGSGNDDYVIGQQSSQNVNTSLHVGFRNTNEFTFAFYGNDINITNTANTDGLYHHWACVYVAGQTGTDRSVYLDGVLVGSDDASGDYAGSGALVLGLNIFAGTFFNGNIDEVRIWNRARTQTEIQTNVSNCLIGNESGLTAYYNMNNQSLNSTLIDITGNGHHGALTNMDPSTDWVTDIPFASCALTCQSEMTQTATVTVDPLPTVTANTTTSEVCAGDVVTLTGGGADTYVWDNSVTDGTAFAPTATTAYTVTGTDANNCSNTASTTVTVNALPTVTANTTALEVCAGDMVTLTGGGADTYVWDNSVTDGTAFAPTATTTYTVTGTDATTNCSNTASETVTVNALPTVTANSTANVVCDGNSVTLTGGGADAYSWDNSVVDGVAFAPTATTTYTVIGTDATTNCSNTASVTVEVANSSTSTINPVACDSYTAADGAVYTSSGNYSAVIPNAAGCDSTITINLTISQGSTSTITPVACDSYTSPSGNYIWTATGSYQDIIPNAAGCDSVITVQLTINGFNEVIHQTGTTLTANSNGATYQWLDCNNATNPFITGETNQTFTATVSGNYAVKVTANGCTSTSACVEVTVVGITETATKNNLLIYPNPTRENITITSSSDFNGTVIKLITLTGQTLIENKFNSGNKHSVDMSTFAPGLYFIEINQNGEISRMKVIKN